jgi:hypothetical protein
MGYQKRNKKISLQHQEVKPKRKFQTKLSASLVAKIKASDDGEPTRSGNPKSYEVLRNKYAKVHTNNFRDVLQLLKDDPEMNSLAEDPISKDSRNRRRVTIALLYLDEKERNDQKFLKK